MSKRFLKHYNFSGGLNTREASYLLAENEVSDVQNMVFDEAGKAQTRKGYETYATLPYGAGTTTTINACDSLTADGTWTGATSIDTTAGNFIEGVGSLKDTITLGETIDDISYANNAAAIAAGWTGQSDVSTTVYVTTPSSLKDTRTMGEITDACDATTGWTGATLGSALPVPIVIAPYEGADCLVVVGGELAYKTVTKNYSGYKDDARFSIAVKTTLSPVRARVRFETSADNYYYFDITPTSSWVVYTCLKGDFIKVGTPNWGTITKITVIEITYYGEVGIPALVYLAFDDMKWQEKSFTGYRVSYTPGVAFDWSDKADSAYTIAFVRLPSGVASATAEFRYHTDATNYFEFDDTLSTTGGSFQGARADLDLFSEVLAPDWSNITYLSYGLDLTYTDYPAAAATCTWYWDSFRWYESEKTASVELAKAMNYTTLDDAAVLKFYLKAPTSINSGTVKVRFYDTTGSADGDYYESPEWVVKNTGVMTEAEAYTCTKGEFTKVGDPTWAVEKMVAYTTIYDDGTRGTDYYIYYDYFHWIGASDENTIRGIYEYRKKFGAPYEVVAADAVLYWIDGAARTDISKAAGYTTGHDWTFETFDNYMIATNGADSPQKWGGDHAASGVTPDCTDLAPGTWPNGAPIGRYCKVHKNRLFIAGDPNYPSWIWWSKIGSADNTTTISMIPYEAAHDVGTVVSSGVEVATNAVTLVCDCRNAFTATGTLKLYVEHSDDNANWIADTTSVLLDGVTPNNGYTWVYDTTGLDVNTNTSPIATATDDDDYRYYYTGGKRYIRVSGITATDKTGYGVSCDATCDWEATAYAEVHTNDGDFITGLETLNDALIIFKQYSTWALIGSGPDDWQLMKLDPHGTLAPKSIAAGDGVIYYLAYDGVRVFDGNSSAVISDKIRRTVSDRLNKSFLSQAVGAYHYSYYQLWCAEDTGFPDTVAMDYDGHVSIDVTSETHYIGGARIIVTLETGVFANSGKLDVNVQHSSDGVTWADADGAAFDQVSVANDDTTYTLIYTGEQDYIRIVADFTGDPKFDAAAYGVTLSQDTAPNMALVYDPGTGCWTIWRGIYPWVFGVYGEKLYVGVSENPVVLKCQVGYDDAGQAIECFMETGHLNGGVPEMPKRFHGLYSQLETATMPGHNITITCETEKDKDTLANRITNNEARQWDVAIGNDEDSIMEQRQTIALHGRYLRVRYEHEGAGQPMFLLGLTLEHRPDKVV